MKIKGCLSLIMAIFLLVACYKQETDIIPGKLYIISTTKGDGYAVFEQVSNNKLSGIFYLDKGQLIAEKRMVDLKIGKELSLVDCSGEKAPILNYCLYEEPEFTDFPETWTYSDSVYAVSILNDVVYGKAEGYWVSYPDSGGTYNEIFDAKRQELKNGKKGLDLTMDVYLPNDEKTASRPLLVLVHGGAFFNGDKTDLGFPTWARYFAGLGYVVASVNYRLGFKKDPFSIKRAGFRAVQDVEAAIRYIVHNKDEYCIDPERVFVAGTSAGGITALNVTFMKDENIPTGAKDEGLIKAVNYEIQESYTIRAVGNMWGAVNDLTILNNENTAVISFHNIGDPVVPYGEGHPFESVFLNWLIFPTMHGSGQITDYLGNQRSTLKPYNLEERHSLHYDEDENGKRVLNSRFYEIETAMRDFFSVVMLPSPIILEHSDRAQSFQVMSPDIDSIYWHVEGGVILKHKDNRIDVLLFPDTDYHSVTVCGKYKNGLTFRNTWDL